MSRPFSENTVASRDISKGQQMRVQIMNSTAKRRLIYFLFLSIVLHLALIYTLTRIPASSPEMKQTHPLFVDLMEIEEPRPEKPVVVAKKPKRVDVMEVKEDLSEEPASLSQNLEGARVEIDKFKSEKKASKAEEKKQVTKVAKIPPQPALVPPTSRRTPLTGKNGSKKAPEKKKHKTKNKKTKKTVSKETSRNVVVEKTIKARPKEKELPSVKELIPSLNDVLAMKTPGGSLYKHPSIVQDGPSEHQARVQYEEYLAEFKSRVKLNWKVFEDPYMHESKTILLIIIGGDGNLKSVKQVKSSGMPGHDTETMYAVRRSFPMRPPPKILLDEKGTLTINFSFHFLVRRAMNNNERGRPNIGWTSMRRPPGQCSTPCFRW